MKTFMKLLALCLLIATLCSLVVACGNNDSDGSSSSSSSSSSSQKPPEYKDPTYGLTEDLNGKNDPGDTQ